MTTVATAPAGAAAGHSSRVPLGNHREATGAVASGGGDADVRPWTRMKCPSGVECGAEPRYRVLETREATDGRTRRRMRCLNCDFRFTQYTTNVGRPQRRKVRSLDGTAIEPATALTITIRSGRGAARVTVRPANSVFDFGRVVLAAEPGLAQQAA